MADKVQNQLQELGLTKFGLTNASHSLRTNVVIVAKKEILYSGNFKLVDRQLLSLISLCEVWILEDVIETVGLIHHFQQAGLVH